MGDNPLDFRNGARSFPEVDLLMERLLAYPDVDYYASESDYPKMLPVRKWVKPSAHSSVHIFPGGNGLAQGVERVPTDYAMVLMHDLDVLEGYTQAVTDGYTKSQDMTATTILDLLRRGGADPTRCFYTNRFMGVRDAEDQYGPNPGRKHQPFVTLSDEMLDLTLATIRPRIVFMLGRSVPDSLGLKNWWRRVYVGSATICGHAVIAASLTHTSFYRRNVITASYGGRTGYEAEVEVIKAAMHMAHLT